MPVTPRRITTAGLETAMRGYDREATDELVREIGESYEQVWRERKTLEERVGQMETELRELRERERLITEALITAERNAHEIRENAREEAKVILDEARRNAEELVRDAGSERERMESLVGRLRGVADKTREDLSTFLTETLERLSSESSKGPERESAKDVETTLVDDLAARRQPQHE